ncbi:MAG: ribosome biogenesis GTP-binding protein YihA/YsxC [Beijerinckiaceae bacterium]|nr:ribosome biogenesis GTP-binding protein YihA/YsxC [Beijerinckiaceae bacterium]MCI0736606.1 ribosome biogenesis GTP-binding protein YihA/YsxC [Beijerinckiaceae bacterium]
MAESICAPPGYFELGRKLFARQCAFRWSAENAAQFPAPFAPEVAFAGRSNVGKSSLLNALTARKKLARISRTPGRTRELHFFALGGTSESAEVCLVDLPGYGYAEAPKEKAASWTALARDFLRGRPSLLRVFLLIDGRVGAKPIDIEMMNTLDRAGVSYQIVLTKQDEMKPAGREERLAATAAVAAKHPAAFPEVICTSSHNGDGIGELRAAIAKLLSEQRCLGQQGGTSAVPVEFAASRSGAHSFKPGV